MASFPLAFRLARREMRGGVRGFRIFLACLTIGVAAIAAVGSLGAAITAGIRADAAKILGGDVDVRLTHRPATPEQREWLESHGRVSGVAMMRAMLRAPGQPRAQLIELKSVDAAYPLYGRVVLSGGTTIGEALARRDGLWGAAVETRLLQRLGIGIGDEVGIGDARFRIAAAIEREPDRPTQAFTLGPRVLIGAEALEATGLVLPGSLVRYHYRVALPAGSDVAAWKRAIEQRFPDAGWRVQDTSEASPGVNRFVDRVGVFLTLVGLTALLVGGVGVGNAVRTFLASRQTTIATMKCLGAPGGLIFRMYLLQVAILSGLGVVAGLLLGAMLPPAAAPLFAGHLPVDARFGVYVEPLVRAAAFGLLVTLLFSLWPLGRARDVPAANLFRALVAPASWRPRWHYAAAVGVCALALATLAVTGAEDRRLAIWFVLGALATFATFAVAAAAVTAGTRAIPRPRWAPLRLALANLHRPGTTTGAVVLSLGLGVTVLVAVAQVESNLARQVADGMLEETPGYYFIDIQPDQVAAFDSLVTDFPGVIEMARVPMLRGRIVSLGGTPVESVDPPSEFAWILRGDRGLTWSREPPSTGSRVVAGGWWEPDYAGPPLVSFDAAAAAGLGLGLGDTITVNVLGREVTATIANLRDIDWSTLAINFVMVFSPGMLESAPQTHIATLRADPAAELALEQAVTDQFPNVSAIRVKEVLESVRDIVARLAVAVRAIAAVALVAGVLVLAGAIAATHDRRVYDAVVLKVVGATRRNVLVVYMIEFIVLGLMTAVVASIIGTAAAWGVVTQVMKVDWTFALPAVAVTAFLATALTLSAGLAGTWLALGRKAAPLLRNE